MDFGTLIANVPGRAGSLPPPAVRLEEDTMHNGWIYFQGKTSKRHRLKWWIKRQWHTKILGREWKATWKMYGGFKE